MIAGSRLWLVGASEGIGRALAIELARRGAILALSARSGERLAELRATLSGHGHLVVPCDVRSSSSTEEAWRQILLAWGEVDGLIYNAGAYTPMRAQTLDLAQADAIIDVNLTGSLRALSHVLPHLLIRRSGLLALVGSASGYCGLPRAVAYGASKAGIISLAETLRSDLDGTGIKVQVINPGFVKTRLTDQNDFPMPGIVTTEDAARFIAERLGGAGFEIRFPWMLSSALKAVKCLPYWITIPLLARIGRK